MSLLCSPDVTLELRLEYLSRAIMSAKSSNLRTSVSGEGEFLHELEEKLEVARIQMQVYEALMRINTGPASAHLGHALAVLNSRLMDITTVRFPFPVSKWKWDLLNDIVWSWNASFICPSVTWRQESMQNELVPRAFPPSPLCWKNRGNEVVCKIHICRSPWGGASITNHCLSQPFPEKSYF